MGLIKNGKIGSSSGAIEYIWRNKFVQVISCTFDGTRAEVMTQFNAWNQLRPGVSRNTFHIIDTYDPNEVVSDKIMLARAKRMLELLSLEGCPFLVVKHTDTDHHHPHIAVSRIRPDGSPVGDSNFALKCIVVSHHLDKEFGMIETPFQFRSERVKRNEYEMMKRTGKLSEKTNLSRQVMTAAGESKNIFEFVYCLHDKKIDVRFYLNKSKTSVRGISFSNENITCAGSKVGRGFSFPQLAEKLGYDSKRDFPALCEKLEFVDEESETSIENKNTSVK